MSACRLKKFRVAFFLICIFSVFLERNYMLFLTYIKIHPAYGIVLLFDALPFSNSAVYYAYRCAAQTWTCSMPLLTSTAIFRSLFFHEVLCSDYPWAAGFLRSGQRGVLWHGGWKTGSCHHHAYINLVPFVLGWYHQCVCIPGFWLLMTFIFSHGSREQSQWLSKLGHF